ncbi:hypothetical protein SAMN06265360_10625 [Haloechinothrix alba]|uniref:Head-tail adaptor n=1 Tax=Haloechinothrix alba TaxID=664784 RepID=A0A238WCR4_9PSEU|nr:hypothetical protein [Haloechinothrix alba]SNR44141.1 hypothetical protein SAMN06265360_10625 [Haloechinothrix alba]
MGIPAWLLRHEITVEPYEGSGANGPIYGDARTVRCFLDEGRTAVRNSEGREVTAEAVAYCPLDAGIGTEDRVTALGRESRVLTVKRRDGGGLPTPDHLEVALQ